MAGGGGQSVWVHLQQHPAGQKMADKNLVCFQTLCSHCVPPFSTRSLWEAQRLYLLGKLNLQSTSDLYPSNCSTKCRVGTLMCSHRKRHFVYTVVPCFMHIIPYLASDQPPEEACIIIPILKWMKSYSEQLITFLMSLLAVGRIAL